MGYDGPIAMLRIRLRNLMSRASRKTPGSTRYKLLDYVAGQVNSISEFWIDEQWQLSCLTWAPLPFHHPDFRSCVGLIFEKYCTQTCTKEKTETEYAPATHRYLVVYGFKCKDCTTHAFGVYVCQEVPSFEGGALWKKLIQQCRGSVTKKLWEVNISTTIHVASKLGAESDCSWLQIKHAVGDINHYFEEICHDIEVQVHESEADRTMAETISPCAASHELRIEAERVERFGPPMHQDIRNAGFDASRFNVAFIGTNDTGKSTLANTFLGGEDTEFDKFLEKARNSLLEDPFMGKKHKDQILQNLKLRRFLAKRGKTTTWDMLHAGQCKQDVDVWYPRTTLWDLPGVELSDKGIEAYMHHVSLCYFDLVILVCDRQLSTDDFHIVLQCQNAMVDGACKPGGVPFFIVRTKMDMDIIEDFKEHVEKRKGSARTWELDWCTLSGRIRREMLNGLKDVNGQMTKVDGMYSLSNVSVSPDRFLTTGLPSDLDKAVGHNVKIPHGQIVRACAILKRELRCFRQVVFRFAKEKFAQKSCALGALPNDCMFSLLVQCLDSIATCTEPPDEEDIELTITTSTLGFNVRKRRGCLGITKPQDEEDLRSNHGIQDDDVLVEFPLDNLVDPKDTIHDLQKRAGGLSVPYVIVVRRSVEEAAERSFNKSVFKTLWGVTGREVCEEDYNNTVRHIITLHAKKVGFPAEAAQGLFTVLRDSRPPGASIASHAKSDWTNISVLMHKAWKDVEFCSMVCAAIRDDMPPLVNHAVDYLLCLRDDVVRTLPGPRVGMSITSPDPPFPNSGMLFRGSAMPVDELCFFTKDRKYRAPMPLAASASKKVALTFMQRSYNRDMSKRGVLFIINILEKPLHVNFIDGASQGEFEFLFAAYSCFRITDTRNFATHVEIDIFAYPDNKPSPGELADSENWPLARWH